MSGIETWYRGTATGTPSSPASDVHDFGPGLYLTDQMKVAYGYAGMRTKGPDQLPYISYGRFNAAEQGRVLYLDEGPHQQAWTAFENRMSESGGRSYKDVMKGGGGNYGRMFNLFLSESRIDIRQYDLVIGPEYINGGRQMCIINQRVASKVEDLLVPGAPPRAEPSMPTDPRTFTLGPTPGRGQQNAALLWAAFANIDFWLGYFNDKFQAEQTKNELTRVAVSIRDWQRQYPTDGALVVLSFSRVVPNSEFMAKRIAIQPRDKFEYSSTYFAETPEEAEKTFKQELRLVPGNTIDGPYTTVHSDQLSWITPNLVKAAGVLTTPAGKWQVRVDKYVWTYEFDPLGGVTWTDPFNNKSGRGTWKMVDGRLSTAWAPASTTTEDWTLPLKSSGQLGTCTMAEGKFPLTATKM